jgi:hypothetical protein
MDQEKWKKEVTFAVSGLNAEAKTCLESSLLVLAVMDSRGDYEAEMEFYSSKATELGALVREIASKKTTILAGQDCPFGGDELISWIYDNLARLALSPTADVLIHRANSINMLCLEVGKINSALFQIAAEKKAKRAAAGEKGGT